MKLFGNLFAGLFGGGADEENSWDTEDALKLELEQGEDMPCIRGGQVQREWNVLAADRGLQPAGQLNKSLVVGSQAG